MSSSSQPVPYSVLDLVPIVAGSNAAEAFRRAVDLARHVESLGYHRYWLAEHHNIAGVASAATSVVIGHVAGATRRIRVGAGGIMLPNHAPLVIAEQFGTLESMYPGRIDLGLGRAPGGDSAVARAMRRHHGSTGDDFPEQLAELRSYLAPAAPGQAVRAVPGEGLDVPIYILGSSDFGARLAAAEGLPFAFASHFAPDYLHVALEIYRNEFRPSAQLDKPHAMVGVNLFAADTDREAIKLFTSLQQIFLNMVRGQPRQLQPPVDSMDGLWNEAEAAHVNRMTRVSAVGSPESVREQLHQLIDDTQPDELILTSHTFDQEARKKSFSIGAKAMDEINLERSRGEPRALRARSAPARG